VATHALALWFAGSPGGAGWPHVSGRAVGFLLIGMGALCAVVLFTKVFKRRVIGGEQRLAAIVECSQDAIIGTDRDGVISVWNPGAERLFGYTQPEAIGQSIALLHPPAGRDEGKAIKRRVRAGEQVENHQTERVCKDGSVVTISLSVSPMRDAEGRVIGASSIARDVTPAIRAQEQVALQAELLGEVDAAVIFSDLEGVMRYWSRGAERLFGYTAEEAVGRELLGMMMPEESRAELLRVRPAARAGTDQAEVPGRLPAGRTRPGAGSGCPHL
jgi:PAS domain S-box-containing protein